MGNNAYRNAPILRNAVNDAEKLGAKLEQLGFGVTRVRDAPLSEARRSIASFTASLSPGDVGLLFYSGHGLQAGGENYIVPVDFNPATGESRLPATCVIASEARAGMEKSGSQLNVIILDACRDNPFRPGATVKGMALMEAGLGTCVALATGPGQTASDNPGEKNGLFSKFLVDQIGTAGQSLDTLLRRVKEEVFSASSGRQRPWTFADTIGEFYFGPPVPSFAPSAQAISAVSEGKQYFHAGELERAAASFERALRIDPENPFTYNSLGSARASLRQWSVALGLYARAIEMKPDYGAAYFNRGSAYYNSARYELALQDFSWAVEQEPFDPRPLDLRGKTYLALRDHQNAIADSNHALELDPSDPVAFLNRGKANYRSGKYEEALRDLSACIAIHPSADAYDARAVLYRAMHQTTLSDADARESELAREHH
jgi:lipoprotein NlpI